MNQLIDTHCHVTHMINKIEDTPFTQHELVTIQAHITRAAEYGVTRIIEVGTTARDSAQALALAQQFDAIFPVVGIHPHEAQRDYHNQLSALKKLVARHHEQIVGIGECGLDKHYPDYRIAAQIGLFKAQIELALEYDKALVVHTRDAQDETYRVLHEYKDYLKRATIHCYSNDRAFAHELTSWGWFLGIGGTITYPKNEYLREMVKSVGIESVVLETDAPFLPPQSMRGKMNGPEQIRTIAEYIAKLIECEVSQVARVTTRNAQNLFRLQDTL